MQSVEEPPAEGYCDRYLHDDAEVENVWKVLQWQASEKFNMFERKRNAEQEKPLYDSIYGKLCTVCLQLRLCAEEGDESKIV
mgnify:CR=1 FL=1